MDGLIIIPVIVSPNVSPRLVPAICKMVERHTLLENNAVLRSAIIKKYSSWWKTFFYGEGAIPVEDYSTFISEAVPIVKPILKHSPKGSNTNQQSQTYSPTVDKKDDSSKKDKQDNKRGRIATSLDAMRGGFDPRSDELGYKYELLKTKPDEYEVPKGINFFSTISLEPTYAEFPISHKISSDPNKSERQGKVIRVGIKAIPFEAKDVSDVVNMMNAIRNKGAIQKFFERGLRYVLTKIPFTQFRGIKKGDKSEYASDDISDPDIIFFSPNKKEVTSSGKLSKQIRMKSPTAWSTTVILSTLDFSEREMKDNVRAYSNLIDYSWGDLVIVDPSKETFNFCSQKSEGCQVFQLEYIKQILNISNVVDMSVVSKFSRPFSKNTTLKSIITKESYQTHVENKILNILRG